MTASPPRDHEEGMRILHNQCTWVKYHYWRVLGMERPDEQTLFTECRK